MSIFKVLVVSYANWDSLMELPGVLKTSGCTVDVFCLKDFWVLQNDSYDKWIEASPGEADFVRELIALVKQSGDEYDWIIPGDDIIIRLLNDELTSEELFYKIMPICKIENRSLLGSKAGFSNLCAKYDVATPRFLIYDKSQTVKSIGDYMGYPLMMKTDRSEAGTGVFKCDNETELARHLKTVNSDEHIVFQQYIDGYDINMEVLYKNGVLMVYSYARLLKILGNFGLSTQRLFYQNTEIKPVLEQIGQSFGINGFASIAFMYSEKEKKHYLIEVDVRPNSWIYYGKFTGNDFAEGIRRIINNDLRYVEHDATKYPKEIKISLYKKDMARAIVQKDVKGVLAWWLNKDNCKRFIPSYDKKILAACNKYLWWFFKELCKEKVDKILGKAPKKA